MDARVAQGDSTEAATYPTGEYVIATSPTYPNGMSDHFKAGDNSKRHTYRQALAETIGHDRPLHENNSGRYGVQYGPSAEARYWKLMRQAVAHWPARVVVNVKDFYTAGERYRLVDKWVALLEQAGYTVADPTDVPCPGQRFGASRQRVQHRGGARRRALGRHQQRPRAIARLHARRQARRKPVRRRVRQSDRPARVDRRARRQGRAMTNCPASSRLTARQKSARSATRREARDPVVSKESPASPLLPAGSPVF